MPPDSNNTSNDIDSLLSQRRKNLEAMNTRLAQYKQRNQRMLEREKELDRLTEEKQEQERRQKADQERLEKERQELYAELQRQQTFPQPRSSPTTSSSPSTTSSQHQQPTSFPARTDSFGKVSEQEAIAWLKQQW